METSDVEVENKCNEDVFQVSQINIEDKFASDNCNLTRSRHKVKRYTFKITMEIYYYGIHNLCAGIIIGGVLYVSSSSN